MAVAARTTGGYPVKTGVPLPLRDQRLVSAVIGNGGIVVYSADGAIGPTINHTAMITKTSAAAMTLAAPTADGIRINIQAGSAYAHVTTATGLIQDGVTGGAKNTYTTAAFVGSGSELISYNGKWHLLAKNLGSTA